jgi:SAM-dependent methyltransferase
MPACIVCEAEVPGDDQLYESLLRCPDCGFVFADISVSDDEHHGRYQRDYFFGCEYADYLKSKDALQKNFRRRIETLAWFSYGGRLYEIGTAYGFFLELAQVRWRVEGIDIAEEACSYAREQLGLDVRCGEFLETPLETDGYDVFCMWDTIEHLREPDRYLEKIARHLRSGGYLALTTGDIGSWSAWLQGKRWRLIHPPTHLYYFSVQTMTRFLDCYGFNVVHLSHPGFYRSLEAMARWFLTPFGRCGEDVYDRVRNAVWTQKAIYVNLFDIMFVIARKR